MSTTTAGFLSVALFTFLEFHDLACLLFLQPQIRLYFNCPLAEYSFINAWHLAQEKVPSKYIRCFYLGSSVFLGVRIGNLLPVPWDELLTFVILYILGKIFILSLTVIITKMLLRRRGLEIKYVEIKSQLEGFMARKRLSSSLQARLIENYHYKYNDLFFREGRITDILSDQIKREVKAEILQNLLGSVGIFTYLTSQELGVVITYLKLEIYLPGDLIIKYGTSGDHMYFISSGTVSVASPSGKEICHLQDGAYFGEIAMLFRDKRRTANVVALETCELYKMNKKGFNQCFKKNKDVMRNMQELATERMETAEVYEELHFTACMMARSM